MTVMTATGGLFHGSKIKQALTQAWKKKQSGPRYKIMEQNYRGVPMRWYGAVLAIGFFLGLASAHVGYVVLDLCTHSFLSYTFLFGSIASTLFFPSL